ncbi:MAG: 1-acyl-sn-glycerol-3-phosphate acyltransferase [Clostridia bacterium]|nr:1-acyl-sn-glycerol-3-phosphate acyltransferase [Clostridia bacterium]
MNEKTETAPVPPKKPRFWYRFMYFLVAGPARLLRRVKVTGMENVDPGTTYLLCSNHIAADDPIAIGAVMKRELRYMAKKELLRIPLAGWFLRSLGAYSVDRKGADAGAVKRTIEFLKGGCSVLMFPQGHRMPGVRPEETKPMPGCAMIAQRAGVPVLPVMIYMKDFKRRPFSRTFIRIGRPIGTDEIAAANGVSYSEGTRLIFSRITEMTCSAENGGKE